MLNQLDPEPCGTTAENESDVNLVLRKFLVSYPMEVLYKKK